MAAGARAGEPRAGGRTAELELQVDPSHQVSAQSPQKPESPATRPRRRRLSDSGKDSEGLVPFGNQSRDSEGGWGVLTGNLNVLHTMILFNNICNLK